MFARSLLILMLSATSPLLAQNAADTIQVRGNRFLMHGMVMKPRQMLDAMRNDEAALTQMRVAKRNYDYASVLGGAGGFLVGWPLGTALAGGEPQWVMAGIGAGLIVACIPLGTAYKRHATSAVRTFNGNLRGAAGSGSRLMLGPTSNGMGLVLQF